MMEDVRRYVEAGLGALTPAKARDAARSLLSGRPGEQVNRTAQDLLEWSRRSRERITELVQSEVRKQLRAFGVATKDDLDALRKRVRELEKAIPSSAPARKPSARKPATRKASTRKASASTRTSAARTSPARARGASPS